MDKNRRQCALQQSTSTINKKNKFYIKQTKCKKNILLRSLRVLREEQNSWHCFACEIIQQSQWLESKYDRGIPASLLSCLMTNATIPLKLALYNYSIIIYNFHTEFTENKERLNRIKIILLYQDSRQRASVTHCEFF